FPVRETALARAGHEPRPWVPGYVLVATLAHVVDTLLDQPGGYLSNDLLPPGVLRDNMPNWEFGVLVQARDLAYAVRNAMSRSQTQSLEQADLAEAEPRLQFRNDA